MNALKIKIKDSYVTGFISLVDTMLLKHYEDDDDKLMMAGLAEIKHRLCVKQLKPQSSYSLKLTPVQALSIRLLYTLYINEVHTAMGNYLHTISNNVKKIYT